MHSVDDLESGTFDHKYTIGLDGQGRIATLVEFIDTGRILAAEYSPYSLQVNTYEGDTQNISGVTRYEGYHGDVDPGNYANPANYTYKTISMIFNLPAESGFEMQEMMLEPMQRLFLPFIYQDDFLD
jgi:hypothetical protein